MDHSTRASLLYLYLATQPFVWINKGTCSVRMKWLLDHGYLEEVLTRYGRSRIKVSEMGKSYAYRELH